MPKPRRAFYLVPRKPLDDLAERQGLHVVLDMLRYDGAKVESDINTPGHYLFSTDYLPMHPALGRWRSMGITIARWMVVDDMGAAIQLARHLDDQRKEAASALQ